MLSSRSRRSAVLLALVPLMFVAACGPRYSDQDIAAAATRLQHLYALRNYEIASAEGRKWEDAPPKAFEPMAWFVLSTARYSTDDSLSDSTVAWGEDMVKAAPENPWSWFALAGALNYHRSRGKEALAASDSMVRLSSALPLLQLRVDIVRNQESDSAGLALIDSLPPAVRDDPVILVRRGVAEFYRGMSTRNDSFFQAAQATFARARAADSTNVEAVYLAGAYLADLHRMDEALPLLEQAAKMTTAPDVHHELWYAIRARPDLSIDQKRAEIQADAEALMKARDLPSTLQAVSSIYTTVGLTDEGRKVGDRLLAEHPNTEAAEWVLVDRYRAVYKDIYQEKQTTGKTDPVKQAEYRKMLEAYIARPEHVKMVLLGDAYRSLFTLDQERLAQDSTVDGDELYRLVRGMVDYEGINPQIDYGMGAVALADDSTHLEEAERIAREGIAAGKKKIEGQRGFYETDGDYQQAQDRMASTMYDALAWVLLAQGHPHVAEDTLLHAVDLNPKNLTALNHLGRVYERLAGDAADSPYLDSAQDVLIRGAVVQTMGKNPNVDALKTLYQRRHGGLEGWDAFHANIAAIDGARRRKDVLAARKGNPEAMKDFTLTSLTGGRVSSKAFRGKVAVINFWGTWCGPCVAEMPELQKFDEKYRNDPGVAVYTVDYNDPSPDDVRTWMTKHKYDFPVLLDDGYVTRVGVQAFPTTWFVDPQGKIDFVKVGWSASLEEEFGWRVEALRKGG